MRLLVLCTHNSARSQMAEGWFRHLARQRGVDLEVCSAGSEQTRVKPEAIEVMKEVGIDLAGHCSKTIDQLDRPHDFDAVLTVCDAEGSCPYFAEATRHYHVLFTDPSGGTLELWREVRDQLGKLAEEWVEGLARGEWPETLKKGGTDDA